MNNWRRVDEIITYYGKGVTPKYVDDSSIIVLNQKCIRNNKIDFSFAQFIDDKKSYNEDKFLKVGDLLVNSTGQGTAGRVAMVDYIPEGYKIIVDSHILVLRTNDFFESKCLNYSLFSIESLLQTFMDGSTGQGEFDKIRLFNVKVGYSRDNKTQQKIASVLSAFDDKIELNNKINVELEAMAKMLYDYWFVQFEFPNEKGKPYKSSRGKMVYNDVLKREIPEGWEVKTIGDVFQVSRGTLITKETSSVGNYKVVAAGLNYSYLTGDFNREKYTITVSGSGANAGYVNFWTERIFASDCTTVRGNSDSETFLGLQFLKLYQNYIFSQAKGSAQPHVYPSDIEGLYYVCPPYNLIETFGKSSFNIYEKISNNLKQNQELAQLRDWLLPMLMNGQVTVSEMVIGDRINEYANNEDSHDKLVAETFGEYLPKKVHNINDTHKELAALVYLMNNGLGANYGNVAFQKARFNSSFIMPNLYSKKYDFVNHNFGTFSKELANDLNNNPYLKTKKIGDKEVYEIEPSKKKEILNILSSPENKDFVSSINRLINLYSLPFINKETNKMELLNTVLKIHSDLKITDIEIIYQAMKDWKIKQTGFNTKAEKFSKEDTQQIIELLQNNGII